MNRASNGKNRRQNVTCTTNQENIDCKTADSMERVSDEQHQ